MKQGQLRIGNKGKENAIKIPFNTPETLAEWQTEYGALPDSEAFLIDTSMRGVRIRVQELTRDKVTEGLKKGTPKETLVDEVLDFLAENDVTAKRERKSPGPRKPVEVVAEDKATYSNAEFKAMLEQAGVKFIPKGEAVPA